MTQKFIEFTERCLIFEEEEIREVFIAHLKNTKGMNLKVVQQKGLKQIYKNTQKYDLYI